MRRFSRTSRSLNIRRPSGTCAMPRRTIPFGDRPTIGLPAYSMRPDAGLTMPEIAFSVVDLPAPFGPSSATIAPSSTASETSRSARTAP